MIRQRHRYRLDMGDLHGDLHGFQRNQNVNSNFSSLTRVPTETIYAGTITTITTTITIKRAIDGTTTTTNQTVSITVPLPEAEHQVKKTVWKNTAATNYP